MQGTSRRKMKCSVLSIVLEMNVIDIARGIFETKPEFRSILQQCVSFRAGLLAISRVTVLLSIKPEVEINEDMVPCFDNDTN